MSMDVSNFERVKPICGALAWLQSYLTSTNDNSIHGNNLILDQDEVRRKHEDYSAMIRERADEFSKDPLVIMEAGSKQAAMEIVELVSSDEYLEAEREYAVAIVGAICDASWKI